MLAPLLNERSRPDVLAVVHGTVHCGDRFLDNRFGLFSRRLVGLLIMGVLHVSCGTYAKRCIRKEAAGSARCGGIEDEMRRVSDDDTDHKAAQQPP